LFGGKDKRYDGVFFKERDVLKGIILNVTLPYEELEEVAYGPDIGVNRVFLQFDMTSHIKEKSGLKRMPVGIFIHHVSIKKEKMKAYCIQGIPQVLAVSEELI
jgi:hypothetical protein